MTYSNVGTNICFEDEIFSYMDAKKENKMKEERKKEKERESRKRVQKLVK